MTQIRILHNPRCSKSRQTLELLQQHGGTIEIQEYLQHPPSKADLEQILQMLNLSPIQLMRTDEAEFAELGLNRAGVSDAQLLDAMLTHPKLIQRPIVICNGKAAIGRPPEKVLAILGTAP